MTMTRLTLEHRYKSALIQIRHVCIDNAPASCDKEMALNFVRSVVEDTLRDGPRIQAADGVSEDGK